MRRGMVSLSSLMRRKLFTLLSAASLLVCLAAVTFAVRGIWWSDWVRFGGPSHTAMVGCMGSSAWWTFWLDADTQRRGFAAGSHESRNTYFSGPPTLEMNWLGFSAHTGRTDPTHTSPFGGNRPYVTVIIPHWMLAAAAGVLPAWWMIRRRRASRLRPGHCRRCGYDLRATPDRCPECGQVSNVSPPVAG